MIISYKSLFNQVEGTFFPANFMTFLSRSIDCK